ncbi:MAG: mechanosensitive ion channel family protein [Bacteroidaceae bacterium]|nr:mechanosensitive ion channel family protein [Bacteroidaceae bacterium]
MQKYIFSIIVMFLTVLPSQAVLKEKSLARTLGVLRLELYGNWKKQKLLMARYETQQEQQHAKLVEYMQRSEQISLMLYSQKSDYTFDIAYSCQQATRLYEELTHTNVPYDLIRSRMRNELARYDSLIYALEQLPPAIHRARKAPTAIDSLIMEAADSVPNSDTEKDLEELSNEPFFLSKTEMADRKQCLIYAKALRNNIVRIYNSVSLDKQYYDDVADKVEKLNHYAEKKYGELQKNIFVNGGKNYLSILLSLPRQWTMMTMDFQDKYMPIKHGDAQYSEWRGPSLLFSSVFMVFYIIIGALLSNIILRWVVPKRFRTENYKLKRPAFIMALGILIFIIAVMIIRCTVHRNVIQMSTGLMVNIAWLMEVVLISLLFRLKGSQIKAGVKMYTPFIVMAFIVIIFRIILVPNTLVNIIFPPILLACTIWQVLVGRKYRRLLPLSDKFYCGISLAVIILSTFISWYGYTLLSVQITIWWTFQLAAIQSITCIYDILEWYERKHLVTRIKRTLHKDISEEELLERAKKGEFISQTWFYDLFNIALVPVVAVISILVCIVASASIFEMTSFCKTIFFSNFIDEKGVIQISLFKLCLVIACFFIFKYFNYAARSFYFAYKRSINDGTQDFNKTLARNVIQILVWGFYFIAALVLLKVPRSGIEIISAGLATGMGFASKDLLENFFYGISLMSGRVRVGDYIECDGITGKVESITYQNTLITTLDGSVIAFLNSALFSKNFKNLTRNHQYELNKIPVGVAYGTDVAKVRKLLLDALQPICTKTADGRDIVSPAHPLTVMFSDFGDSSVDLFVVSWLLVDQKFSWLAKAREIIYNVLNENDIEIPFPQRDLHIRKD